jgi:hypothetical protein
MRVLALPKSPIAERFYEQHKRGRCHQDGQNQPQAWESDRPKKPQTLDRFGDA